MTIEQKLTDLLIKRGMNSTDAQAVMSEFKPQGYNKALQMRWDESADNYPSVIFASITVALFDTTVRWIDQNKPEAWYRGNFVT